MLKELRFAVLAALALASTARAQTQEADAREEAVDAAALKSQLDSLAEQVAVTRTDVSGLKRLKLSGYVQARYGWLERAVYGAGATERVDFHVRRGRFKAAYDAGWSQYVLQIDAVPSGIGLKEAYASLKLPWDGLWVDAGLQLLPFGYEVLARSSSELDLLERSEITGRLLRGEYDLGVSLRGERGPLQVEVGIFNGNGLEGGRGRDNDRLKDVVGRAGLDLGFLTGGVSGWYGRVKDWSAAGAPEYDRSRIGADLQLFLDLLPIGGTALKGEYLWGVSHLRDANGGAGDRLGVTSSGWYALVTQNVGRWNQLAVRYQYFVPQTGRTEAPTLVRATDEISFALHTYVGENLKLSAAYYVPRNADAGDQVPDLEADRLVVQAQARF